jgi:hypothetical protein
VNIEDTRRRLVWHGMFLFLLGLLTGLAEPQFKNLHMALAAHLESYEYAVRVPNDVNFGRAWNVFKMNVGEYPIDTMFRH